MEENFEMLRSERRSFFCPNTLWKELREVSKNEKSISKFIRDAIIEKINKT